MITPITIPLLNPNEPEALLAARYVVEGNHVSLGDALCTVETTKSTHELVCEREGFIVGMSYDVGSVVQAGDVFGFIADSLEEWEQEKKAYQREEKIETGSLGTGAIADGLRITQPALGLAQKYAVDLSGFPKGKLITEKEIRNLIKKSESGISSVRVHESHDSSAIVVVGGGGHGKAVIDLLRALRIYQIVGLLDDGFEIDAQVMGVPVLGGVNHLSKLYEEGIRLAVNAVGGISKMQTRVDVFDKIHQVGMVCPSLIHPQAYIEPSAHLAGGGQVFPLAYIGSEAQIGYGCIVNTGVIVSHDCILEEYVNLSPNATLAGHVEVGRKTLVGMGVTINLKVKLGSDVRIGNGATVKADVSSGGIVRAGAIYPP